MAPPKSDDQVSVPARFNKRLLDKMDALIKSGQYSSRSVLIKTAVENLVNEDRAREEADKMVREAIRSGAYDTLIADRLRILLGPIVGSNAENSV